MQAQIPVFLEGEPSSPASSISSGGTAGGQNRLSYAQTLALAHSRLASLPMELAPPSRLPSPRASSRSELLKERVTEAITIANSDVTHPKWDRVAGLLTMACTSRGYRGAAAGVRVGAVNKVDVGDYDWVLPETEEGWRHCERRWETRTRGKGKGREKATTSRYWTDRPGSGHPSGEGASPLKKDLVREKVENWKATIIHNEDRDIRSLGANQRNTGLGEPTKRQAPLEFPVTKHPTSSSSSEKPTRKGATPGPCAPSGDVITPLQKAPIEHSLPSAPIPENIADLPELSFLPPSFPRELQTSTPQLLSQPQPAAERRKPPPIYPRPFLSSSPPSLHLSNHSPHVGTVHAPPQLSSSLPNLTSSSRARKRDRPLTPPPEDGVGSSHAHQTSPPDTKRHRTDDLSLLLQDHVSSAPMPPSTPPPSTPPPVKSLSSPNSPPHRIKELGNANGIPMELTTPNRKDLPTLTDLLASSRRSKPRPRPPSRKSKPAKNNAQPQQTLTNDMPRDGQGAAEERLPSPVMTYFSSPASGSSHSSPVERKGRPQSPVSPLLAHSLHMKDFAPPFASTQQFHAPGTSLLGVGGSGPRGLSQNGEPLGRGSSGILGMGYNSQFDVEAQVGEVNALLERDVDFDVWLKDLPDEVE